MTNMIISISVPEDSLAAAKIRGKKERGIPISKWVRSLVETHDSLWDDARELEAHRDALKVRVHDLLVRLARYGDPEAKEEVALQRDLQRLRKARRSK